MGMKSFVNLSVMTVLFCATTLSLTVAQEKMSDLDARKEAVKLKPADAPARYYLGNTHAELGQYKEALDAYKEAVRLNPDFAEAYVKLGDVCVELRKEKEAIDAYREAVKLNPDDAQAHFKLATVCLDIEKDDCFRDEFEIVEKLDTQLADELRSLFKDKFGEEFTPRRKR